jgi:hypothetical protein
MTPDEAQGRVHKMIVLLNPDAAPKIVKIGSMTELEQDFDCLELMIKYFIFDREASIREAIQFGNTEGGDNVK